MGKDNTCKPVPNHTLKEQERIACSVCGTIWTDGIPNSCPKCRRRVKKSAFVK